MEAQSGLTKDITIIRMGGLKGSKYQNKCLMCIIIQPIVRK